MFLLPFVETKNRSIGLPEGFCPRQDPASLDFFTQGDAHVKHTILILLASVCIIACAGSPAPAPEQEGLPVTAAEPDLPVTVQAQSIIPPASLVVAPDAPPDQNILDTLNAAIERAGKSRQEALSFGGSTYFPEEWDNTEGRRTVAEASGTSTLAEVWEAISLYDTLANAYDDINEKSLPRYIGERKAELEYARGMALAAGAESSNPEELSGADKKLVEAYSYVERRDYHVASNLASQALTMYRALEIGALGFRVRKEIVDLGFTAYDPDAFEDAELIREMALEHYRAGNYKPAQEILKKAFLSYNRVLRAGWESFAAEKGREAVSERDAALVLKADVAVRDAYNNAVIVYQKAQIAFKERRFEDAIGLYIRCGGLFADAGKSAVQKRQDAESAISSAAQKIAESEIFMKNAEQILEGDVL
jgi:tetratricopeptide (TPR) repeat protein